MSCPIFLTNSLALAASELEAREAPSRNPFPALFTWEHVVVVGGGQEGGGEGFLEGHEELFLRGAQGTVSERGDRGFGQDLLDPEALGRHRRVSLGGGR